MRKLIAKHVHPSARVNVFEINHYITRLYEPAPAGELVYFLSHTY
jgi:hypothetical protein